MHRRDEFLGRVEYKKRLLFEISNRSFICALGMSELYRVKVPKCGRWRQAHSQRQGLNREVPTEGSPRQTIDLTNRNGLRHMLSGKTARQVEAQKPHGGGGVKTEGT